jgi:hypothetical protein
LRLFSEILVSGKQQRKKEWAGGTDLYLWAVISFHSISLENSEKE